MFIRLFYYLMGVIVGLSIGFGYRMRECRADFLETQDVNIEYKQFMPNGFSPYMVYGNTLGQGVNLNLYTNVLKVGYLRNQIWSLVDQSQFRWIGWNYEPGIRVTQFLDLSYEHFSRHELDSVDAFKTAFGARFPVEDSINLRIHLYRKEKVDSLL